jgi:RNA polymerase sigma factor (sigma-70 family)
MMEFDEHFLEMDNRDCEQFDADYRYEQGFISVEELFDPYFEEDGPSISTRPTTEWDDVLLATIAKNHPVKKYTADEWYEVIDKMHEGNSAIYELSHFSEDLSQTAKARLREKIEVGEEVRSKAFFDNIRLATWFARETMGFHRANNIKNDKPSPQLSTSNATLDSFRFAKLPFADRFQVACIALQDSIETYSPRRGGFASYALKLMRNGLSRAIADNSHDFTVRINAQRQQQLRAILKLREEAASKGEALNAFDVSFLYGLPVEDDKQAKNMVSIENLVNAFMRFSNLDIDFVDELLNPEDDYTGYDDENDSDLNLRIEDVVAEEASTSLANEVVDPVGLREVVSSVLSELSDREYTIVELRFGLNGEEPRTLEEVGAIFGLTRERIRQIEAKTMAKLRDPKLSHILTDYQESSPAETHESYRPGTVLVHNPLLNYVDNEHNLGIDYGPSKKRTEKPKKKFIYREDWSDEDVAS